MLTSSTTIVHQKASGPISPINGYGPAASLHHPALESNLSSQPQSPPHASPTAVNNSNTNTSVLAPELMPQGTLPAVLGPTISHQESYGSLPLRTKRPQPQEQEHVQRRQSTLLYFQPKDSDRRPSCEDLSQGLLTPEDSNDQDNNMTTTAPMMIAFEPMDRHQQDMTQLHHHHNNHQQEHQEDKKLVVRLDLRKLGTNGTDVRPSSKKISSHRHSIRKKSLEGPASTLSTGGQPTLSAHSWAHAKSVQNGSHNDSLALDRPIDPLQEQQPQPPTEASVPDDTLVQEAGKDTSLLQPLIATTANVVGANTTITRTSTPDSELRGDLQNEGDPDCVATSSRSMKRSNSSGSWTDQTTKKRTRSSNQGGAKKKKVMEERRPQQESQHQEGPALKKKGSLKQMAKASSAPSALAPALAPTVPVVTPVDQPKDDTHTGDDTTVDPPIDPMALPDEWNCNECQAIKYPPKPNPKGIFKQLLDNINKTSPKAFALPSDIKSFFKGVVANSDGEYEDAVDYKPRPKRAAATANSAPVIKADSEALQLHDSQGRIRLCFQCGMSALRDRFMISCDHCPLHWHLDCLSPPMACPPPSTNKWMCPNHADHVMPRRRKRKDATVVELKDPQAANDGMIEVIPDPESSNVPIWNQDTSAILFRVPERNIKHSFVEKCQRIRDQQQQEQQKQQLQKALSVTQVSAGSASIAVQPFDLLIAAAMADDRVSGASLQSSVASSSSTSKDMDVDMEEKHRLQETVLGRMTDPAERQEYQRFRAFQRYLKELGSEDAMKRWLEQQEREKEEIAKQSLLGLF
ncbi:hypothetical protein KI688_006826 [Linnemannia hyalina]|uniref:Zinc finger PHD-type domain-containing protein n=1 Tax=Linnemannia hyalina TaxID=64524 RepID=A0A9P7XIN3_9FUNG|nr:hypothetical protein KI688_006826 [Linnemannia hyalina]